MGKVRLDKFLSDNTLLTRSEIKKLIRQGRASVNGKTEKSPEAKLDTDKDSVVFCEKAIENKQFIYLMLNKPAGILSASSDKSRKTVVDLAPDEFKHYGLFPVGRLDKDTTGLLILTNDGDYAHKVISPKSGVEKSYIAQVDKPVPKNIDEIFAEGVTLADGTVCKPAKAEISASNTVRIIITEGKYHEIKRMLGTVHLGVEKLHRERIGGLTLPQDLSEGEIVEISPETAQKVFILH